MKVKVSRLENEVMLEFEDGYVVMGEAEDIRALAKILTRAADMDGTESMDKALEVEFFN